MELNLLTFSYGTTQNKTAIEEEFNGYAEQNNLNFTVNVELVVYDKPTDTYSNFHQLTESFLKKNRNKYDIYYYDSKYSNVFGPYLADLKYLLPKDIIDIYDPKIINETSIYEDKLIGLVIY